MPRFSIIPPSQTPPEPPSFLDKLKEDITEPHLDENPLWAALKGFGAGAITGAQDLGQGVVDMAKHPLTAGPPLVRGATGLLSAEGGLPGAAISGGGELAAEALEGSLWNQSPWRTLAKTGAAAGIGAIPMASTIKAGRVLPSMARSAAYAGGGEATRELAAGEGLDAGKIATNTAVGGVTGATLAKLLGLGGIKTPEVGPPERFRAGENFESAYPNKEAYLASKPQPPVEPVPRTQSEAQADLARWRTEGKPDSNESVPYGAARPSAEEVVVGAKEKAAQEKDLLAQQKADAVAAARRQAIAEGKEPVTSYSEGASAPRPGGLTGRTSTRFVIKDPSGEDKISKEVVEAYARAQAAEKAAKAQSNASPELATPTKPAPAPAAPEPGGTTASVPFMITKQMEADLKARGFTQAEVNAMTPADAHAALSKPAAAAAPVEPDPIFTPPAVPQHILDLIEKHTPPPGDRPGGHTGMAYRNVQKAAAAGEEWATPEVVEAFRQRALTDKSVRAPDVTPPTLFNKSGSASAGGIEKLDELGQMLGAQPTAPSSPSTPRAPDAAEDWISKELDSIKKWGKDESGAIDPSLAIKMGGGGLGALLGGYTAGEEGDPENKDRNRVLGALAGGAAGFGGAAGIQHLMENGGIDRLLRFIPRWQRTALLTSSPNSTLANVFAGPWGSGMNLGLEKSLGGDAVERAQGRDLLKRMFNFKQLGKDWWGAKEEAQSRIGRSEGDPVGANDTVRRKVMASPGTAMTMGDMSVGKAITDSGFSQNQSSRATLTSEPEFHIPQRLASLGRGKLENPKDPSKFLMEMMFPFRRTPMNIFEQGAMRFPGLGSWVQSRREVPDSVREQVVQQLLNAGWGAAGYGLGASFDPETAKTVQKYGSNLAAAHSMMFGGAFAAGQAHRSGQPVLSPRTYQRFANSLPLPTTQSFQDWLNFAGSAAQGKLDIPQGMIPLRNSNIGQIIGAALGPDQPSTPPSGNGRFRIIPPGQ